MLIVDEVSFMNIHDFYNLKEYLHILCDDLQSSCKFGDFQVLFVGDVGQLIQPKLKALCEYSCLLLLDTSVNLYLSLMTNHLFKEDVE